MEGKPEQKVTAGLQIVRTRNIKQLGMHLRPTSCPSGSWHATMTHLIASSSGSALSPDGRSRSLPGGYRSIPPNLYTQTRSIDSLQPMYLVCVWRLQTTHILLMHGPDTPDW